jgi:hypothetical protein
MTFCEASNKRFLDFDLEKLENAIIQFFLPLYKAGMSEIRDRAQAAPAKSR